MKMPGDEPGIFFFRDGDGTEPYGVPKRSLYSVEFMKPLTIARMSAGSALIVRSQSL